MNQNLKAALVAVGLGGAAALLTAGVQAAPEIENANARVTVLEQIVITEIRNLDFGVIDKPRTGMQRFTVELDSTGTVGPGDGGSFIGNAHHTGKYDITGTDGDVLVLITRATGCSDPTGKLGFEAITDEISEGPVSETLDVTDLDIGGRLRVPSDTVPGSYTCSYSISASYQ